MYSNKSSKISWFPSSIPNSSYSSFLRSPDLPLYSLAPDSLVLLRNFFNLRQNRCPDPQINSSRGVGSLRRSLPCFASQDKKRTTNRRVTLQSLFPPLPSQSSTMFLFSFQIFCGFRQVPGVVRLEIQGYLLTVGENHLLGE